MNKTLNKSIAIAILTIVALSIIPAVALVIPVKAQAYTITTSSAYLNNYSWIEIIITGPAEWNDVTFEVINKRTGGTIELWDGTQVVASGTAKKYASGVFVAYLGGLNVSRYPIYNKTNAFYNVTSDLTGETLVIRVPSLGFISTEVKYDFAPISISFDRSEYPPSNSAVVRLTVNDPNWNLDPTNFDQLPITDVIMDITITNSSGTNTFKNVTLKTSQLTSKSGGVNITILNWPQFLATERNNTIISISKNLSEQQYQSFSMLKIAHKEGITVNITTLAIYASSNLSWSFGTSEYTVTSPIQELTGNVTSPGVYYFNDASGSLYILIGPGVIPTAEEITMKVLPKANASAGIYQADFRVVNASAADIDDDGNWSISELVSGFSNNYTCKLSGNTIVVKTAKETEVNSGTFRYDITLGEIAEVVGVSTWKSGDVVKVKVYHKNNLDVYSSASFTIKSVAPSVTLSGSFSEEITVSVNYPDANLKSWEEDELTVNICAYPSGVSNLCNLTPLTLTETGKNTGVFEESWTLDWNQTLLSYAKDGKSIVVKVNLMYAYDNKPVEAFLTITPVAPKLSLAKTEYYITEKVTLVVEDPDLNDDKDAVEVYSATVSQNDLVKDVRLEKSGLTGLTFMNISLLKLPEGTPLNATGGQLSLSLIERYAEPGVFDLKINISVLNITEDSWYRIKVVDHTSGKEVNIDFKVVKMAVSVSLDRSTYPLVRDIGKQLIIYVYITDPDANKNPYAKDTIPTSEVTCTLLNYTMGQKASCSVSDITETDVDTGMFKGKVTLSSTDLDDTNMINGKIKVGYGGKVAEAVFRPTSASLFVNASVVKYGDYILVRLTDADMNLDIDSAEEISVGGLNKPLKETGKNTGVFEGTFLVAGDGDVSADPAKTFEISYTDKTPGYIAPGGEWEDLELSREVKIQSFTGKLSTDKDEYGPASSIVVRVEDFDANSKVKSVDYVRIYYVVEGISGTNPEDLEETDVSSGVFEGEIDLSQYDAKDIIGKRISIVYRDPADAAGAARTLSKVVKVISVDPVIGFDKSYYLIGDVAKVTINDMDANKHPDEVETINVRILSDSDPVGITIPAVETEENSGVFEASFLVSDTYGAGKIFVNYGDKIYAEYRDEFPADYAATEKPKTFTASVPVGVPIERPIEVKKASFIDPRTGAAVVPKVGSMVGISVELSNVGVSDQVFTVILVVKDPDGIVVKVDSVTIPLGAGKSGSVTFSFTPKVAGDFGIEVYVVKSLADWSPLGEMLAATMTVAS